MLAAISSHSKTPLICSKTSISSKSPPPSHLTLFLKKKQPGNRVCSLFPTPQVRSQSGLAAVATVAKVRQVPEKKLYFESQSNAAAILLKSQT